MRANHVSLDDDVVAAVQALRAERHLGLSEAINELIRAGLAAPRRRVRFVQRSFPMGARIDVSKRRRCLRNPGRTGSPLMYLVPDAQLVALVLEQGLTIYSADSDFARFPEVSWVNPVAGD